MCAHNVFAKFVSIFFVSMFMFVYIADYKTWMPTFKIPFNVKKVRQEKQEQETNA